MAYKAAAALGVLAVVLYGKMLPARADPRSDLKLIADTADQICVGVSQSGSASTTKVTGDIQAKLNGLAKKLADLGVSGTGSITSTEYQGVLQEQLAATLKDERECKEKIFDMLQKKLIPDVSQPPPKPILAPIPKTDLPVHGWLKPANYPTPPTACHENIPAGAAVVIAGDNAAVVQGYGKVIVLKIKECEALSFERSQEGVLLNATVSDGAGLPPVRIVNNQVDTFNGQTYHAVQSPDESTLTVTDSKDRKLLLAEFLNKSTIRVQGIFGCPGGQLIPIINDQPTPWTYMHNTCMIGFGTVLSIQ